MQHGRHADDGRCAANLVAHGILRGIDITVNGRERSVITNAAAEDIGHAALFTAINNAVVDVLVLDKCTDAAVIAHAIDGVEMVIMSVRHRLLRINVLPQRGVQVRALQIVRRQRISRQNRVDIAVFDQLGHGRTRIVVKSKGRTHDPDDLAVVSLVAQQIVKLVIIAGKSRLA